MTAHRGCADIITKSALKADSDAGLIPGCSNRVFLPSFFWPDTVPPELSCTSAELDEELVPVERVHMTQAHIIQTACIPLLGKINKTSLLFGVCIHYTSFTSCTYVCDLDFYTFSPLSKTLGLFSFKTSGIKQLTFLLLVLLITFGCVI